MATVKQRIVYKLHMFRKWITLEMINHLKTTVEKHQSLLDSWQKRCHHPMGSIRLVQQYNPFHNKLVDIKKGCSRCGLDLTPVEYTRFQRRVICAAYRGDDGQIIIGVRHGCPIMNRQLRALPDEAKQNFKCRLGHDQGFIDQWGVYMDREEALEVALRADQVIEKHPPYNILMSEDIY